MNKRIRSVMFLLLAILALVFTPQTVCAADGKGYDETELRETAGQMLQNAMDICSNEASYQGILDIRDRDLDYILTSSGYPVSAADFKSLIRSWKAAQEECGAYDQSQNLEELLQGYRLERDSDGVRLVGQMRFADRPASVTLSFARDGTFRALTVGGKYTISEILKKAGLNTLIGMGTVFGVLILISLLISTFVWIPRIQDRFSEKTAGETARSAAEETEQLLSDEMPRDIPDDRQTQEPLRIPDGAVVSVTVRERPVTYVTVREWEA